MLYVDLVSYHHIFLGFGTGFGTSLWWSLRKDFTHRPPGKYFFWIWDPKKTCRLEKTILSNFCSGAAILIFVCLAANRNFVPKNLGEKLWFVGKRTKISVAAAEQKLLRIVFPTYISFFRVSTKKIVFSRGPVCEFFFNKCLIVGKWQQIEGRAIKLFLYGSNSW